MAATLGNLAAWSLAVVFAWAAVAKLSDRGVTERGFDQLGLAAPSQLARIVPVVEAATAAGLLIDRSIGAVAAFAVIVGFTTVLVRVLAGPGGGTVDCNCFGGGGRRPVGPTTIARNIVLLALSVAAALL